MFYARKYLPSVPLNVGMKNGIPVFDDDWEKINE
jgi:hypothetical protein